MKWAVLLGSAAVGGGTYVIFEHAVRAMERGAFVTIVTMEHVAKKELYWHDRARNLNWKTLQEAEKETYDVVICTWWRLVYEAYRLKGKHYIYFVQSVESRFYPAEEKPLRQLAEATYMLPMPVITEAAWIKEYLAENYLRNVRLVRNGIRKDIYMPEGKCYAPREKGRLRVLVEGPIDVEFKNVPKTVALCRKSEADEIWLMTSSDIKSYPGTDRVFSKVPIEETPLIYRSCDVIVKLSYVEGMFGPPLEMFHCGGTAVTYDVTGYDEYIEHGINALVAARDDDKKVIEYLNKMKREPGCLEKLKAGALHTASQWNSWEQSSALFYETVEEICRQNRACLKSRMEKESKFHFQSYMIAEDYHNQVKIQEESSILKKCWIRLKRKIPLTIKLKVKRWLTAAANTIGSRSRRH